MQGLLTEETTGSGGVSDTQLIDNVWRPAEAYHFYILAQRQFKSNNTEGALRSALTLTEYEDILPVQTIYNLIGNHPSILIFSNVKLCLLLKKYIVYYLILFVFSPLRSIMRCFEYSK